MPQDSAHTPAPTWLDLERILPLKEASDVSGLSQDSLKRHHADKVVRVRGIAAFSGARPRRFHPFTIDEILSAH